MSSPARDVIVLMRRYPAASWSLLERSYSYTFLTIQGFGNSDAPSACISGTVSLCEIEAKRSRQKDDAGARRAAMMASMASGEGEQTISHRSAMYVAQPPAGSVRTSMPYRDELLRHRVITADGHDYAVATHKRPRGKGYITGAYPVQHGYLVMVRQPLCELRSEDADSARYEHEQLVQVLAEAGIGVVRARRALAARQRAEKADPRRFTAPLTLVAAQQADAQAVTL